MVVLAVYPAVYLEGSCSTARPKHNTGNHMAECQVLGQHLVRLALYCVVHPEGTIAEARAFLMNTDPTIAPSSPQEICRAEHLLGLRKKAASTTCVRAFGKSTSTKGICLDVELSFWKGRR